MDLNSRPESRFRVRDRISELLNNNDSIPTLNSYQSPPSPTNLELDENIEGEIQERSSNDNNISNNNDNYYTRQFKIENNLSSGPSDMDIHFMNVISQIDLIQLIEMNSKKNDGLNNSPNAFYCGFLNHENKPSGYGMIVNQNNDCIQGYFENGLSFIRNAKANINNIRYESEILNGLPDGAGSIYYPNGNVYIGNICNGMENGIGRIIYYDKAIYNGNWNMGNRDGEGEYIDGENHYKGLWKNNKKHGDGVLKSNGITLTGEWVDDMKHGLFTETTNDGDNVMVQYENDNIVYRGAQISGEIIQLRQELEKEKTNNKKIIEDTLCKICLSNETNVVLPNCGHLLCASCVDMIDSREKKCPQCRTRFTKVINIYK